MPKPGDEAFQAVRDSAPRHTYRGAVVGVRQDGQYH